MPNTAELLEILLRNRGIAPADAERFLHPSFDEHCHDPYLLKDMERAIARIFEATEAKESIVIYSDYDCDGIPAAVILHDFFTKIGYKNFLVYIPDRHDEGYGLHSDAIHKFIEDGVTLIITFDLGITAVEEVTLAQAAGVDVIITDHHVPHEHVPPAYAIINPKQDGCTYPDNMLCGAGLAFKLVQGLVKKYGEYWNIPQGWEKWLLDMAGVATLSDQVPLVNENRVLAYFGLKVLQKNRRPGLQQFFKKAGVDTRMLVEDDVTFTLAPKLNAASRMDSPMRAFELLATSDLAEAGALTAHLMKINEDRKHIVATIMKEVKATLGKRLDEDDMKPLVVIGNPKWRVGVLGLVATKIAEEYKRSAFVWGMEGGDVIKGSCRGWGSLNLVALMTSLPEGSLLEFGGHVSAGGFAVAHTEIHYLEDRLITAFNTLTIDENVSDGHKPEASITIDDVTNDNFKVIDQLAPFGMGNPKPIFEFGDVAIHAVKEFGKEKNHLELMFLTTRARPVKAIAFFKTRDSFPVRGVLTEGARITLHATFEKSTFAGRTELRLRIVDIL